MMKALRIYAGPAARKHIEQHGLRPAGHQRHPRRGGRAQGPDPRAARPLPVRRVAAAIDQPVHLVGASIGAWRMATACLDDPAAFERFERDYIAQHYEAAAGRRSG
jgi:hypothetical protein